MKHKYIVLYWFFYDLPEYEYGIYGGSMVEILSESLLFLSDWNDVVQFHQDKFCA